MEVIPPGPAIPLRPSDHDQPTKFLTDPALAELKKDDPGRYGCLVVNTIVELPEREPAVEQQIQRYEHMLLAGFTSALERTNTAADLDVEHRANVLLALALAVNLHARNRDTAAVAATTASAHALIDTWT